MSPTWFRFLGTWGAAASSSALVAATLVAACGSRPPAPVVASAASTSAAPPPAPPPAGPSLPSAVSPTALPRQSPEPLAAEEPPAADANAKPAPPAEEAEEPSGTDCCCGLEDDPLTANTCSGEGSACVCFRPEVDAPLLTNHLTAARTADLRWCRDMARRTQHVRGAPALDSARVEGVLLTAPFYQRCRRSQRRFWRKGVPRNSESTEAVRTIEETHCGPLHYTTTIDGIGWTEQSITTVVRWSDRVLSDDGDRSWAAKDLLPAVVRCGRATVPVDLNRNGIPEFYKYESWGGSGGADAELVELRPDGIQLVLWVDDISGVGKIMLGDDNADGIVDVATVSLQRGLLGCASQFAPITSEVRQWNGDKFARIDKVVLTKAEVRSLQRRSREFMAFDAIAPCGWLPDWLRMVEANRLDVIEGVYVEAQARGDAAAITNLANFLAWLRGSGTTLAKVYGVRVPVPLEELATRGVPKFGE